MSDKPKLSLARRMRAAPSFSEARLWDVLRGGRLDGLKFRRQVPIGRFIADFVCQRHRMIVEADGPFHDPDADDARDRWLREQGYRVLRFRNEDIADIDRVVTDIRAAVEAPLDTSSLDDH